MPKPRPSPRRALERAAAERPHRHYVLRLYIAGMTPRSKQAVENIRRLCVDYLSGRHDLEVVDIYQNPTLARGDQILAAPTLVKHLPLPLRRFVGDMSDTERILVGMDLGDATPAAPPAPPPPPP